jgi:hypothetical protein
MHVSATIVAQEGVNTKDVLQKLQKPMHKYRI